MSFKSAVADAAVSVSVPPCHSATTSMPRAAASVAIRRPSSATRVRVAASHSAEPHGPHHTRTRGAPSASAASSTADQS